MEWWKWNDYYFESGLRFESWEEMSDVQVDDLQDAIETAIMLEKFIKVLRSDNQVKEAEIHNA